MRDQTTERAPVIVNRLSRLMGERRLSIQELVRRSGISYGALHDLYHAKSKRFDADVLDRLCRTLGVGVGDILEYAPEQTEGRTLRDDQRRVLQHLATVGLGALTDRKPEGAPVLDTGRDLLSSLLSEGLIEIDPRHPSGAALRVTEAGHAALRSS